MLNRSCSMHHSAGFSSGSVLSRTFRAEGKYRPPTLVPHFGIVLQGTFKWITDKKMVISLFNEITK